MGQDLLVREVLGESYVGEYQKMKRREWKNYLKQVTKWELEQYCIWFKKINGGRRWESSFVLQSLRMRKK